MRGPAKKRRARPRRRGNMIETGAQGSDVVKTGRKGGGAGLAWCQVQQRNSCSGERWVPCPEATTWDALGGPHGEGGAGGGRPSLTGAHPLATSSSIAPRSLPTPGVARTGLPDAPASARASASAELPALCPQLASSLPAAASPVRIKCKGSKLFSFPVCFPV